MMNAEYRMQHESPNLICPLSVVRCPLLVVSCGGRFFATDNGQLTTDISRFFCSFIIHHSSFIISSPLAALRLQYSQSLPWVILLLAILAILIVLVYPAQLRQIPRGLGWLLPALRILAVGVVGLSILRPVVTRPRHGP